MLPEIVLDLTQKELYSIGQIPKLEIMKENKERIEKRKSKGIQMAELKEIIKWGDMRRKMSIWKKSNSTTQQKFEVFNPYKEMISDDSSYFNNSNALSESEMD